MNGPEHYAAAEKLAGEANGADVEFARYLLAKAQVHATLAVAAAAAGAQANAYDGDEMGERARGWAGVA